VIVFRCCSSSLRPFDGRCILRDATSDDVDHVRLPMLPHAITDPDVLTIAVDAIATQIHWFVFMLSSCRRRLRARTRLIQLFPSCLHVRFSFLLDWSFVLSEGPRRRHACRCVLMLCRLLYGTTASVHSPGPAPHPHHAALSSPANATPTTPHFVSAVPSPSDIRVGLTRADARTLWGWFGPMLTGVATMDGSGVAWERPRATALATICRLLSPLAPHCPFPSSSSSELAWASSSISSVLPAVDVEVPLKTESGADIWPLFLHVLSKNMIGVPSHSPVITAVVCNAPFLYVPHAHATYLHSYMLLSPKPRHTNIHSYMHASTHMRVYLSPRFRSLIFIVIFISKFYCFGSSHHCTSSGSIRTFSLAAGICCPC
jgi:hypothetical protein